MPDLVVRVESPGQPKESYRDSPLTQELSSMDQLRVDVDDLRKKNGSLTLRVAKLESRTSGLGEDILRLSGSRVQSPIGRAIFLLVSVIVMAVCMIVMEIALLFAFSRIDWEGSGGFEYIVYTICGASCLALSIAAWTKLHDMLAKR